MSKVNKKRLLEVYKPKDYIFMEGKNDLISFLKRSPVDTWNKLCLFTIKSDWVPFPAPGGPKIIIFIFIYRILFF